MAFRTVAAYAPQGVTAFSLGVVGALFSPRSDLPGFEPVVCAHRPGPVHTDLGLPLEVAHGLEPLATADLVFLLPGTQFRTDFSTTLRDALWAAYERGAIVAAHCVGVFLLAEAGLLDGRTATTHWQYAAEFAARYPAVTVRADALYCDQGNILTGAGAVSGIDLGLHLIRREHGATVAGEIARALVTPLHRDGGQVQYISAAVPSHPDDQRLREVLTWAQANLDRRLTVADLAERALMSRRSFARRFTAATGTTPHAWLIAHRLNRAEELLEATDLPVEEIARRVGYGGAALLREQFILRRGVPPRDYRRTFATGPTREQGPHPRAGEPVSVCSDAVHPAGLPPVTPAREV
ncbi:GlxA family transcriptional regulator [Frankia sp. QA3]|uniref:GlxA family transcriptional regulator n=1 Tax=Frankia sp. QA3 TaxID=710111 RepID=UPI000269CE4D|nr:helix-turn-helix domain-containing protein [Frankia sp. QA3]EIV96184.1 transcriptional regulator containing an amidase domain and an AraC-type DNA-binding HTH domain [Frankia sp. QA3]